MTKIYILLVDNDWRDWEVIGAYKNKSKAEKEKIRYKNLGYGENGEFGFKIQELELIGGK